MVTANLLQLVTCCTKRGKEEEGAPSTESIEVTLTIDIGPTTDAIDTLSMDQLVVLEGHIFVYFNIIKVLICIIL